MLKKNMWSIYRKWMIIVVLAAGIYAVSFGQPNIQEVSAAPCCESCPGFGDPMEGLYVCQDECILLHWMNPSQVPACIDQCMNCYNFCIYCSGGGPYGECMSSSDCPIGSYCGSDDHCHPIM